MILKASIELTVDKLSLSRGALTLIHDLNLNLHSGGMLWLTGPNGIGKTTLLMALANLLRPDEGTIHWLIENQPVPPKVALTYAAHRGVERNGLTLGEDLSFWQKAYSDDTSLSDRLEQVGLTGREETPVAGLSAGQRRRLSLARLLSSNRPAWLMDEPLAGLDHEGRKLVTDALSTHLRHGGLAIIASHHPVQVQDVEARKLVLEPGS